MSVRWMAWAWERECSSAPEKLVLMALADHAGEDGKCWPATAKLQEKTGLSRASVFRHLAALEDKGALRREQRFRDDGSQTSSVLWLVQEPPDPRLNLRRGGSQHETGPVSPATPLEPSLEPSVEEEKNPPTPHDALDPDGFDDFWAKYPRKVGKPDARKKLITALRTTPRSVILEGLWRWKVYWQRAGTELGYIPNPATWLHQRRWEDDPPPVPAKIAKRAEAEEALVRIASGRAGPAPWELAVERNRRALGQ